MVGVARQYVQLELPAFALACLMLMPHSEKRHQQIKVSSQIIPLGLPKQKVPYCMSPAEGLHFLFTIPAKHEYISLRGGVVCM